MLKLNFILKSGLLTALTVVTTSLTFQPPASAWKITRTGRELPVNQSLTISNKSFSCGEGYGFIPGAVLENNGLTSTVFMDKPLCLPYSPLGTTVGNPTVSFSFKTTNQGVKVDLRFSTPESVESIGAENTDNWTLEGYIEQVSLGNGSYRKNIFTGEGTEQTTKTFPTSYHEGSFNSGSVGLPIGSDPYYSTKSNNVSSDSTFGPTAEDYRQLWSASGQFNLNSGGIFRRADYGYLMQPHWGAYWPSGNVVADDSIYYKLSSYFLQPGRDDKGNDKDIIPILLEEKLVEHSLLPNFSANTIYVDESKSSWLAQLATPNEVNTLEKITSPLKAYNPNQIIKDIEFKPELSNNKRTISFNFAPKTEINNGIPIQLGTLAKALGYEYFNYLQMISGFPKSEILWDGNGKRVVYKGKITTSKGMGAFFDALPGGNISYAYDESNLDTRTREIINSAQLSPQDLNDAKTGFWVKADTQPFYNDVPGYGGKQPGDWGTYEHHANLYSISMNDTPLSSINPNNEHKLFHTLLVGVKDKGKTFHLLEGLGKHWSSNTTCSKKMPLGSGYICTGGISGGPSELLPEFTTGGIEILDDSVTFDELPDDVIALLTSSGGKLINTDGSEYIRNQDTEAVPEPSSILGLMMALGVGAAMKRKFR